MTSLAVSGSLLYAGGDGVYVRLHGGWIARSNGLPSDHLSRLAADSSRPGVLYATFDEGALMSTIDGGRHWHRTSYRSTDLIIVGLLAHDGTVVVGSAGRMLESPDGGRTWRALGGTLPVSDVWDLGWDGSRLYAATSRGVYTYGG